MRIAADIGGTFTDLVYWDEARDELGITKVATTPANFGDGVIHAFDQAAREAAAVDFFVHGTTVVINALTERKGVVTGLITTKGFRDVLEIGRANRPDIYNMVYQKPPPFVPRYLRREVRGRMNYRGEELASLCRDDVGTAAHLLLEEGAEAIAVCFLHSYINPTHELECGAMLSDLAPGIPITLSHQITQEWREYERSNTAVLNAYVQPIVQTYLGSLADDLVAKGIERGGGFIQDDDRGVGRQSAGNGDDLPLPAAELARVFVHVISGHIHHIQEADDFPQAVFFRLVDAQWQLEDLLDGAARVQRGTGILEDDLDLFLEVDGTIAAIYEEITVAIIYGAAGGQVHAHGDIGDGRFSGTALTDDAEGFPFFDAERDTIHGFHRDRFPLDDAFAPDDEMLFQVIDAKDDIIAKAIVFLFAHELCRHAVTTSPAL